MYFDVAPRETFTLHCPENDLNFVNIEGKKHTQYQDINIVDNSRDRSDFLIQPKQFTCNDLWLAMI